MRKLMILALVLAAGPARADVTPVPSASIECFEEFVALFDDGTSPADVIATAVGLYCFGARDLPRMVRNLDALYRAGNMTRTSPSDTVAAWTQFALPYVLQHRVAKRR